MGHCGSVACATSAPCRCDCLGCRVVRLRVQEQAREDKARAAHWMAEEKRRARIEDGRDVIREYRAERGGRR